MMAGDLVKLSAYGKQKKRAEWINPNDVGIVVKVIKYDRGGYDWPNDYQVRWQQSEMPRRSWHLQRNNTRKDLKYAK